ncbi:MAG TPA: PAS domain S-box protein, partial [Gemmatimonadaceae bacterium]
MLAALSIGATRLLCAGNVMHNMIRERTSTVVGDWQSLRRRLPLLTTGLLTIAVAAIAGTAYFEMRNVLLRAAGEHLRNVSQQFATMFATSEQRLEREGNPLGRDSSILKALAHPDSTTLAMARTAMTTRANAVSSTGSHATSAGQNTTDSHPTVELWDAHRVRLTAVGDEASRPSTLSTARSAIGPLIAIGDTVFTQAQVPVLGAAHDTLGYLREMTRVSSAQSNQLLSGLIGGRAQLLIANKGGDVWTDLGRKVPAPVFGNKRGTSVTAVAGGEQWLGSLIPIAGTPWQIWLAAPEAEMLGQAHAFLVRILVVALIVIALGFVGARLMGQRVVGPIGELTRAAESLAGGEYATRARVSRSDEVGRMAVAFNKMATAIETALLELENQQVELETQQVELQEANEELRTTVNELTVAREAEDRSNARASAIVAGAIDAVVTIDQDQHIVEFNPAAERAFGVSASTARGRSMRDLLKTSPLVALEHDAGSHNGNGTRPTDRRVEATASRADGSEFAVEMSMTQIPVDGPPMYTCFLRDVSDKKQLEAELQRSQKMEAIGRLAGGVAHDFNNMLTVIVSYADLVLFDRGITPSVREDLSQIRSAADRAAMLTRQLLAFSRKQVLHPSVLDVNVVIGDVASMLARVIPENIRLTPTLGSQIDPVYVDRGQLEQVIMNLAVNARDAMPEG